MHWIQFRCPKMICYFNQTMEYKEESTHFVVYSMLDSEADQPGGTTCSHSYPSFACILVLKYNSRILQSKQTL